MVTIIDCGFTGLKLFPLNLHIDHIFSKLFSRNCNESVEFFSFGYFLINLNRFISKKIRRAQSYFYNHVTIPSVAFKSFQKITFFMTYVHYFCLIFLDYFLYFLWMNDPGVFYAL